ncbi:MAG: (E)-4-hydroxy-3-methylbut-2-enyl-diphosphate synthase [Bacteroidales bacterium]|nr:(E)-4-hydroxy-3-methylbut-2-enyl-diphosphate synthase [Bacteroidales bacterium]
MYDRIPSWIVNNPIKKRNSKEVLVGNIGIGGFNPVRVQSMTNTDTMDTMETVKQCISLAEAGCELVRITASNVQAAENLYNIKNELEKRNYQIPLIADIHFNPKAAEVAAKIVDKVRINPGNYTDRNISKFDYTEQEYNDELSKIADRLQPLIEICKENKTAMRIGTNHGSLSKRIMNRYGDTPYAMAVSAMEFVRICHGMGYDELVLSMKSSNVKVMNYSTRILAAMMQEEGLAFPIHLGVTEAGNGADGRIKSMSGIGSLLAIGIGDTIRVSLTEKPENEIPVARQIVEAYKNMPFESNGEEVALKTVFSRLDSANASEEKLKLCFSETNLDFDKPKLDSSKLSFDSILTKSSKGKSLVQITQTEGNIDKAKLAGDVSALIMEGVVESVDLMDKEFEADLLQATGEKIYKAEFIACPSCGRTKYDIQQALEKVKQSCSHLKGLKIAVMGCIVNGPGEMADANYGYIGSRENKVHLYREGKLVHSNVDEKDAIELLISMIKEDGKWQEEK